MKSFALGRIKSVLPFTVSLLLCACGGSSTATISIASNENVVVINNHIGVTTQQPAALTITADALPSYTLTEMGVTSSAFTNLNVTYPGLNTQQFSTTLELTPKENATFSAWATTLGSDNKSKKNTNNYTVHNVVRYMHNDDRQVLSIHTPMAAKSGNPAILFIRGNGLDFSYFYPNAVEAADQGYVAVTMDFRTFDSFDADASHMPDQIEDVRCAIQYLKANSGTLNINPENIGVVGYSVGALLGLLTAFDTGNLPNRADYNSRCLFHGENTHIKAMAALSAPNDLLQLMGTMQDTTTPLITRNAIERMFGVAENASKPIRSHYDAYKNTHPNGTLADWKSAIQADYPATTALGHIVDLAQRTSPENVLGSAAIPLYIMHGKTDLTFPCDQAIQNVAAASQSDVYFYVFTASSNDHNWQDFNAIPKQQARQRYLAFFDHYLAGASVVIPTNAVTCDI